MDATPLLIDGDAELLRARALFDQLWNSNDPTDIARLFAVPPQNPRCSIVIVSASQLLEEATG